jgi:hypothetical protein
VYYFFVALDLCSAFFSVICSLLFAPYALFLPKVLPFFFLPFTRSPLPSFYKASGGLGGGNGRPPKCSVTDVFNEETYALAANGRNVSAFNGRAVAEEEDGEQSLQNDSVF